ncbi:hypothetical protein OH76DRAFT_1488011 [Lentinus brumalis]|uniref:F-box domain-containing protein n=1 Tax=Lentinus brumalis TaxID=2498619 RepID=A0A371CSD3_9APHY|nr:hypothetical protein OH76DRAFT_1488011 [Polyporus brumalis]
MADALPSPVKAEPRLPIEVCERVIEAVYNDEYDFVLTSLATLSRCALVCRAWRPRAQRILFEHVLLRDKHTLYRFAALLDASPELETYVRTLELRGHLHVPYSPAVLFLTALRGKLTNLAEVYINGFDDAEKAANPLPEGEKELPFLPIYRYFPSLLRSISHIRRLDFVDVRFPSFGDFARFLNALPNLKNLHCYRISWAVLGLEPVCMAKRSSHDFRKTFLPNFEGLTCVDMDERGRQRLLAALGPSLRELWIKFPNDPPAERIEHLRGEQEAPSVALNLRPFPCLDRLVCRITPFTHPDQTLESLQDTLVSWMASSDDVVGDLSPTQRCLYLAPVRRSVCKREEFVALLRTIGPVVEPALRRKETTEGDLQDQTSGNTDDRPETNPCRAGLVVTDLGDRLEWEDWWRQAVAECFPTLSRWKRLYVFPTHGGHPEDLWDDHDLTPQDYADRLQAMADLAEARRRRRRSTRDVVKKFLPSRGILMHVRQKRKGYYQPTCLRRTGSRSSSSLRGRRQNVCKTRIYSVSTFNIL